ncbi:unnamed protein product [Taenia asiatica]|uniref:CCR4-NOT transcription complex subunit 11 n=1 Tax=Taenia asiatica TaxID=60517 RepID=A0A0R3VX13_TAEAS|nr:unnamed protein product [Taenia asiatica]
MYAPGLDAYAVSMEPYPLKSITAWITNVNYLVAGMDPSLLRSIIANVKNVNSILLSVDPYVDQGGMPHAHGQEYVKRKSTAANLRPISTTSEPIATMGGSSTKTSNFSELKNVSVTQFALSSVPNIPPLSANVLLNKDSRFLQYIIENQQNLSALLTNMDAPTLQYVTEYIPKFGCFLANLSSITLKVVFGKLSDINEHLEGMNYEVVKALVAKVPSLAEHAPTEAMTTAPTVTTSTEEPEEEVVEVDEVLTAATERLLITDEELELVRSKMPCIDKVLLLAGLGKLAHMRQSMLEVIKFLVNLDSAKLETIKSYLHVATDKLEKVKLTLVDHPIQQIQEHGYLGGVAINFT